MGRKVLQSSNHIFRTDGIANTFDLPPTQDASHQQIIIFLIRDSKLDPHLRLESWEGGPDPHLKTGETSDLLMFTPKVLGNNGSNEQWALLVVIFLQMVRDTTKLL